MIKDSTGTDDNVHIMLLDVANREQVSKVTAEAKKHFGFCHIVINNAGIMQNADTCRTSEKMCKLTMDVNCLSNIWIVKDFLNDMLERDEGQIVTISSLAGLGGVP